LRSWYHQHLRLLNDAELLAFTVILKANPRVISSFVRRLIQSNTSLGLPLVSTDIAPDDSLLLPIQYHGAGYLEESSSWQHISISDDIRESGGSFLAGCGAQKPSQDSSEIPISAEIPGRVNRENRSNSYDLGGHGPNSHTQPSPRSIISSTLRCTKALRKLARSLVHHSHTSGCKQSSHQRKQTGIYTCTLGCGYQSKRHVDLFRHEQTVYPQQFWFCFLCDDVHNPSEKHFFTRDDKIRKHIQSFHPGVITTRQCEVIGVRTLFPERFELCLHHRHKSWKHRSEHIVKRNSLG
jgi:hypothetical protein